MYLLCKRSLLHYTRNNQSLAHDAPNYLHVGHHLGFERTTRVREEEFYGEGPVRGVHDCTHESDSGLKLLRLE